jgi:hypothetical protein
MESNFRAPCALLASLFLAAPALADEYGPPSLAITPRTGMLGHGADLSLPLAENLNLRVGYGQYTKTKDVTESDVEYNGKLTLSGGMLVADWFPFGGNFRLSAGAIKNRSKVEITAKPTGTVTFDGVTYNGADINANGKVSYEKTAPYIGLGYGNASARSRIGFFAEFGVAYQKPEATLTATCNLGVNSCTTDPSFQQRVANEQRELQADAEDLKWYPVVQLGMSIRF